MDLNKMSLDEIKSLAYDQILLLDQTKSNLNILNAEIEKRGKEAKVEKKK